MNHAQAQEVVHLLREILTRLAAIERVIVPRDSVELDYHWRRCAAHGIMDCVACFTESLKTAVGALEKRLDSSIA